MAGILLLDLIDHRKVELLASLGHKEALTVVKPLKLSRHQLVKESLELLPRSDRVQFAIDCAKRVLYIFENKYPDDNRPRKAIEAAELALVNDTNKTRALARAAAYDVAAYDADADATTAYDADADATTAADAAYAAYAAADAAWAAADAADATWAAVAAAAEADADKETEIRIQNQQLIALMLQL